MIGAIGSKDLDDVIMFEVSPERILTVQEMIRRNNVRFAENAVLLKKPVSQYVGPAIDEISMKIMLSAQFGVHPQEEHEKLIRLQRDGTTVSIMLGSTGFGTYRWRIDKLDMKFQLIDNKGFIATSPINIVFREYPASQRVETLPTPAPAPPPPPAPAPPAALQAGDSIILNGPVFADSFGNRQGRTFINRHDTITITAPRDRPTPYHIGGIGWARPGDITRA